ncbi:hypothetical protein MBAV_005340 [Candidatus Magnetobacterium bavaricum]|uniref:Uncharacterized protein n=1 Tax=Candidatus Magnetobacterium bavaricum TaxID=29290 RepID=A0A0F3GKP9_9BACT|nr:hypothetical protein MBAV_005340 [Candidatus Magnetobacterium bavaricum]
MGVGVGVEAKLNVAVMFFAADIITVQVELDPVQSPLQPVKVEPEFAVAVRVTDVPEAKEAVHDTPQLIP